MFAAKTVIIVGAGASREAGLPTGNELKDNLATILDIKFDEWGTTQISGHLSVAAALKIEASNRQPPSTAIYHLLPAAWQIRDALPLAMSIDNYLDTHTGNLDMEICGKLAIVQAILDAEKRSLLYFDNLNGAGELKFNALDETWYCALIKLFTENCRLADLKDRLANVHYIVFNYDRCLEHFLFYALQKYYGIGPPEALDIFKVMNIYHPYGTVGPLDWTGVPNAVGFGAAVNPKKLLELARHIKTFAEGTDPTSSEISTIRYALREAKTVLFLGFAFHRMNMRLLYPGPPADDEKSVRRCFGTAKGFSDSDRAVIRGEVAELLTIGEDSVAIGNLTCNGLFGEYWRSLAKSWRSTAREL